MVTGAADSYLKLWEDCTTSQLAAEKLKEAELVKNEQNLSNLLYDQDYQEAAFLAFKLNKQRDFHFALSNIIKQDKSTGKLDEISAVIQDTKAFDDQIEAEA
jgi:hypothetical protein